ncbi:hypothetical protein BB560_003133 [Smittium megazygosporum]|uniref:DUF747 family protein n=1 Tax=Smittium megazygosporum TaxID=133381 RepID=A0A2T9ZCT9_9FUNG|nr:hypothetical protein BB560_003133 [Smittium megazygosporum]
MESLNETDFNADLFLNESPSRHFEYTDFVERQSLDTQFPKDVDSICSPSPTHSPINKNQTSNSQNNISPIRKHHFTCSEVNLLNWKLKLQNLSAPPRFKTPGELDPSLVLDSEQQSVHTADLITKSDTSPSFNDSPSTASPSVLDNKNFRNSVFNFTNSKSSRRFSRQIDVFKILNSNPDLASIPSSSSNRSSYIPHRNRHFSIYSRPRSDSFIFVPSIHLKDIPNLCQSPSSTDNTEHLSPLPPQNASYSPISKKTLNNSSSSSLPNIDSISKLAEAEAISKKNAELLYKRIINFLHVPWEIEKLMVLGLSICSSSLLKAIIDLPAEAFSTFVYLLKALFSFLICKIYSKPKPADFPGVQIKSWEFADRISKLYKASIIVTTLIILSNIDTSHAYHLIRAQSTLKLYFIFNSLELIDKLCVSFGLDVIDSIQYSIFKAMADTESYNAKFKNALSLFAHATLGLIYIIFHSAVLYIQVLALNSAANSYSQQLLSLLISNQFLELKGNILKKFEKENFFQLACGDIIERFQQSVFMLLIFMQNFSELANSEISLPPTRITFSYVFGFGWVKPIPLPLLKDRVIVPICLVLGTEFLVDWIKHAFITKYNWLRPQIFSRYGDILCRDLVGATPEEDAIYAESVIRLTPNFRKTSQHNLKPKISFDTTSKVARRIGLLPYSLAVVVLFITIQSVKLAFGIPPNPISVSILVFQIVLRATWILFSGVFLTFLYISQFIYNTSPSFLKSSATYILSSLSNFLQIFGYSFGSIAAGNMQPTTNTDTNLDTFSLFLSNAISTAESKLSKNTASLSPSSTHTHLFRSIGSVLFLFGIYFLVINIKSSLEYRLEKYSFTRYLKFCTRNIKFDDVKSGNIAETNTPNPLTSVSPSISPSVANKDSMLNSNQNKHPSSSSKPFGQTALQKGNNFYDENFQKLSNIKIQNPEKERNRNSRFGSGLGIKFPDREYLFPPPNGPESKSMSRHKRSQNSISKYDDLSKASDIQHIKNIKALFSNSDPEDLEWEKRKPVWSLDNVSRYSIVKSRIP